MAGWGGGWAVGCGAGFHGERPISAAECGEWSEAAGLLGEVCGDVVAAAGVERAERGIGAGVAHD